MIILNIALLVVGFVFLIKGADIFVDGASSTASNFKVSKMLIGLTIVAFGTSAPELAVSFSALANNSSDMLLGNVIGSNIMNILLILGIASIVRPIKVNNNTVRKEIPLLALLSTLLVVLILDTTLTDATVNSFSRADGFVVLLFFGVFIYYLISLARKKKDEDNTPQFGLFKSLLLIVLGLIGIVLGSEMVVDNASIIATTLGLSERVIALSVIAFGTSLPELVTSIVAAKKGETDLLMGNIIGSNIFNICMVLGIPVAMFGAIAATSFHAVDLAMLIISSIMLFVFSLNNRQLIKYEGLTMLLTFFAYYILVFAK